MATVVEQISRSRWANGSFLLALLTLPGRACVFQCTRASGQCSYIINNSVEPNKGMDLRIKWHVEHIPQRSWSNRLNIFIMKEVEVTGWTYSSWKKLKWQVEHIHHERSWSDRLDIFIMKEVEVTGWTNSSWKKLKWQVGHIHHERSWSDRLDIFIMKEVEVKGWTHSWKKLKWQVALYSGAPLPLCALRLLVPPIRLVSAAIWQTVQQKVVADYGMLEEFVSMVTDIVPELLTPRQRAQLIMGLRARVREDNY